MKTIFNKKHAEPIRMAFSRASAFKWLFIWVFAFSGNSNSPVYGQALSYGASPYGLSGVEYTGNSYDFSAVEGNPRDIAFNDDGTKLYILGQDGGGWVRQYNLSVPYDIDGISGNPTSISLLSYNSEPEGVSFNTDGSKLFYLGRGGTREVVEFQVNLGGFDITGNMTPLGDPFTFSYLEESYPSDLTFNEDGTKMYILGYDKDSVKQYSLSTPFVVNSGVTDDGNALYVGDLEFHGQGLEFSADGQYLYLLGFHRDRFLQYKLNVPFDLTQGIESVSLNTIMQVMDYQPMGFAFDHTGNYVYVLGGDTRTVYEYRIIPEFTEHITNDGSIMGTLLIQLESETFTNAGGLLQSGTDYQLHNLPVGLEPQLTVATDGLSAQLVLNGEAQLHQPEDDFSDLRISFYNTAFTGGDASLVTQSTNAATGTDIKFIKNKATLYSTASDGNIRLHWPEHPDTEVTQYRVMQFADEGDEVIANIPKSGGLDTMLTIQDLENNRSYRYRVLALNDEDSVYKYTDGNGQYLGGYEEGIPNESFGHVASFDGDNDYIQVANDPLLKQNQGTVEFWIRMEKLPGGTNQHYAIANKHDPNGSHNGWNFYHNLEEFVFVLRDGSNPYRIFSGLNLIDSAWHHIAFTYDLTGTLPCIGYIDGDSIGAITSGPITISEQPVIIGRSFGAWWTQFEGEIDEFRIWDHQRTETEITDQIGNRSDGTDEGLVMVLNLDEPDSSDTANDGSPNNLNGIVVGDVKLGESQDHSRWPFVTFRPVPDLRAGTPELTDSLEIPNEYPTGLSFSPDGKKMFTVGELTYKRAYQYDLDTAFAITSAVPAGYLDITLGGSIQGIQVSSDGSKLFLLTTLDSIHQLNLSTPFDITTAGYQGTSFYLGNETTGGFDFVFAEAGRKLFVVDLQNVYQYTLQMPYDITSASYDGISLWIGDEDAANYGLAFSKEGLRMFTAGIGSDRINQYDLTVPFDLSTATFSGLSLDVSGEGDVVRGLVFNDQHDQLFTLSQDGNRIFTFNLPVGFRESQADDGSVVGGYSLWAYGVLFTQGSTLTFGSDYNLTNLPDGLASNLQVSSDGSYSILTLSGNALSHKAIHSVEDLGLAFTESAFQGDDHPLVDVPDTEISLQFFGSDAPVFTSTNTVTVEENSTGPILDVQAHDGDGGTEDEGIVYSLDSGDGIHFTIDTNTGVLFFTNTPDADTLLDTDGNNVYEIIVTADDGTFTTNQLITITVTNLNDNTPVIAPDQVFSLDENSPVGTVVGTVAVNDGDAGTTFSGWNIIEGAPGFAFSITEEGQIIQEGAVDYEDNPVYQFYVEVSDGENFALAESITVEINDLNESPILKTPLPDVELDEGFDEYGIDIAGFFEDPDGDVLTIEAVSGAPSVVNVSIVEGTLFFQEMGTGNATITITADDGLIQIEEDLAVIVNNINDAPIVVNPPANQELEVGFSTNTTNLEFVFEDPDNDALTYSAMSSNTDVVTIEIDGTNLIVREGTDTGSATVDVTATDPFDQSVTTSFSVIVSDQSKLDQTIDFPLIPDKTFGDESFELQASASSGLPVSFSIVSGPAVLQGNTVTLTGAGSVIVLATQAGNESYNPSTFQRGFEVAKTFQVITIEPISDKLVTDPDFEVMASTTSGLTLTYEVNGPADITGTTISLEGTGTVTLTVSQGGNQNYHEASASTSFLATDPGKNDQTISFEAFQSKTYGDEDFELTATASSGLPVSYSSADQNVAIITGSTVTLVGAGTTTITASQAGDEAYNPAADVVQTLTVNKASQTISFNDIPDQELAAEAVSLTATASSGLQVSFQLVAGDGSIQAGQLIFNSIGTYTVTAVQAGNENYEAAEPVTHSFEVTDSNRQPQTITFEGVEGKVFGDESFSLVATATSELNVEFSVIEGSVTLTGSEVTINGAGSVTLAANQPGDETYLPAPEVRQTFVIAKGQASIVISDLNQEVDGIPKEPKIATVPENLSYTVLYDGSEEAPTTAGTYTVVVTIDDENYEGTQTATFTLQDPVPLRIDKMEVSVYPNPTQDYVIVKSPGATKVFIYDLEGRLQVTSQSGSKTDLSGLRSGTYLLICGEETVRIIKK